MDPLARTLIEEERFDDLEDLWMNHLEKNSDDLDFFVPILRTLVRRELDERCDPLLELLLESAASGNPDIEHRLLRRLLQFLPKSEAVNHAWIENLRRRYPERQNLENLIHSFKLRGSSDPVATAKKIENWLLFDKGTLVYMEKRGIGRVEDINLSLGSVRVAFKGASRAESFRQGEAEKLLEPLPPGHFLRARNENIEKLQKLAKSDPGELLRWLFDSMHRPLNTVEIKAFLEGVVAKSSWTSWWKKARTDPRITVGSGTRPQVTWSESASDAEEALSQKFLQAKTEDKLTMARQHGVRSEELLELMATSLAEEGRQTARKHPGLALEAVLTIGQVAEAAPGVPQPIRQSARELAAKLLEKDSVSRIVEVQDRAARQAAFELLQQSQRDWPDKYLDLLQLESDSRCLASLYNALAKEHEKARQHLVNAVLQRPREAPRLFAWLVREMSKREELAGFCDWAFLRRLMDTLTDEHFKGMHASLREHFDAGGLADAIVSSLNREQSEHLLRILDREMGLEEHRKEGLRTLVWRRHPEIQENEEEEPLYATAEALESKRAEFERLVRQEIPENTEEIRKAAAHGDLRENFEYKSAREKQEMLSSRAKNLHEELRRARALDPQHVDPSAVRVGTRVTLRPSVEVNGEKTLTILGPWDSDPERSILSYKAPAIAALLGKKIGDTIEFSGEACIISKIQVWTDE